MEQLSRRLFLQIGTVLAAGTLVPQARCEDVRIETRGKILPLVIFFQGGAQSAYEFVSPLVNSPKELRGEGAVVTAANGMPLDERWPEFAKVSGKAAVLRSLHSGNTSHDAQPVVGQPGKLGEKLANGGLPHAFLELPSNFRDVSKLDKKLGMDFPWDPEKKCFKAPEIATNAHLDERLKLLRQFDTDVPGPAAERMHKCRDLAASLLTGGGTALKAPFVIAEKSRKRYGEHPIGDACALASAFAQSGAGVTIVYNEFQTGWDLHSDMKKGYETIIPPTDKALSQLILDARRHGFVVLMTSEHGRTPVINRSRGRDHFTTSYAVMAGGETKEGAVVGSVARDGSIRDEEVRGPKLMATVLHAAGVKEPNKSQVVSTMVS